MFAGKRRSQKTGYATLVAFVLGTCLLSLYYLQTEATDLEVRQIEQTIAQNQALALAEAGANFTLWQLERDPQYRGVQNQTLGTGTFTVTMDRQEEGRYVLCSTGQAPIAGGKGLVRRTVKIVAILEKGQVRVRSYEEL